LEQPVKSIFIKKHIERLHREDCRAFRETSVLLKYDQQREYDMVVDEDESMPSHIEQSFAVSNGWIHW
jgi:hypothetical protein